MLNRADQIEAVKNQYQPRILAFMEKVRKFVTEKGYTCSPVEDMNSGLEFKWSFVIHFGEAPTPEQIGKWREQDLSYDLTIAESEIYDGEDEKGMSFLVDLIGDGGLVAGVFAPFNYTDQCWVDMYDAQAVEGRWKLFEDGYDFPGLFECIEEYPELSGTL